MNKKNPIILLILVALFLISGCSKNVNSVNIEKTISADTANESKPTKLSQEYFIPNDHGKIKYSWCIKDPNSECTKIIYSTWSKDKDVYTNKLYERDGEYYSTYKTTAAGVNWLSSKSVFYNSEWYEDKITDEDSCVYMKYVVPGTSWTNQYKTYFPDEPNTDSAYEDNNTFIGFENITVLGKETEAAHISVTNTNSQFLKVDKWYVKGLGLVLSETVNVINGKQYIDKLTMLPTAKNMTDIERYREFLEFRFGGQTYEPMYILDTPLIDIDHDGKKEIIVFEYDGQMPINDMDYNTYNYTVYKNINGNVEKIYQDKVTSKIRYGSWGQGVEVLRHNGQDCLMFWYNSHGFSGGVSIKYLKNNEMVTVTELEIDAPYNNLSNWYEVEQEEGFILNDNYFHAFLNGTRIPIAEARQLLDSYFNAAECLGFNGINPSDYLGKSWTE